MEPLGVFWRLYIYALHGIALEVGYTALWELVERGEWGLGGYTSLWSAPIYAFACLLLENLAKSSDFRRLPSPARAASYTAVIFAWELWSGTLLRWAGAGTWDYAAHFTYHYRGLITLEYAPLWAATALAFEQILLPTVDRLTLRG